METLFIYLIKSSGLLGMFYLAYIILLRKETFFNSNRWFLLAGLISSALLPLIVFTKIVWVDPTPNTFDWSKIPMTTPVENEAFEINWYLVFAIVYSIGILLFLMKFAFDFYSLSKVLKGKTIQQQADFKFIDVKENVSPFSYFNSIVYNSSLYSDTELENILEHEKVHSAQNHTVDVLVSRLFCIVFWFNPLVWLYKKVIVQNLEFIADSEASKNISDKKAYQLTLLKITTQENCVAITNHFYQSFIKKRIVMLNKKQSNKRNSWKYAAVLPILGAFLFFFQVKVVAQEKVNPKQENETKTEAIDLTKFKVDKDLITLSKGKEIYINGEKSSQEELAKLDPKDIISIDVIQKSGNPTILVTTKHLTKPVKITDKDIYIDGVKSTNEEFSKLDQNSIENMYVDTFENTVKITTKGNKPIVILNGTQTISTFKIDDIPTDQIESVNVLKGKVAEEKYGADAKYGAIEISTKNGTFTIGKTENTTDKPMIIINGKKAGSQVGMNNINSDAAKSMNVLKGKSALDKYGKEGENGIVEITTDKPDQIIMKIAFGHPMPTVPSVPSVPSVPFDYKKANINTQQDQAKKAAEQEKIASEQAKKDTQQAKIDAEQAKWDAEQAKKDTEKAKKKKSELDKSEIENTGNEIVSSKGQWLETYKAILKARFSLEKMKAQKEQAKADLEKARIAMKSKLFS
jgi:hypothetical protein